MYNYPNSSIYVPTEAPHHFKTACPKCGSKDLKDEGGCSEGCCDDYSCKSCGHDFRIEWPD